MSEQLHITHSADYLRDQRRGYDDSAAGRDYRPQDGAAGTVDGQRAGWLGYADGWAAEQEKAPESVVTPETWTLTVTTASGRVAWAMEIDVVPEHSDTIDGPAAIIQAYNQLGG